MKKSNFLNIVYFIGMLMLQISCVCVNVKFIASYTFLIKLASLIVLTYCCVFKLKYMKITYRKLFMLFIVFFIGIVSYYITKDITFLELFVLLLASMNFNFRTIVKIDFKCKVIVLLFVLICNKMGYATSEFLVTRGDMIRNAFGFYHPNTFGMYLMVIFFEYLYLNKDKKIRNLIIAVIFAIFIHYTSDTRSAIYSIIGISRLSLGDKYWVKIFKNKFIGYILNNIYLILLLISVITTMLYCSKISWALDLNEFLSNRLYLQSVFWNKYGLSLFGRNIDYTSTLDNGYMKILLNYGLFTTLVYGLVNYTTLKKASFNKDYEVYFIVIILLLYSIAESSMLYVHFNIFILYFFCKNYIFDERKNNVALGGKENEKK